MSEPKAPAVEEKTAKKEKEPQGPLSMAGLEMEDSDQALTLMPKFKTFGEIFEYCNWVASSSIVPEAYRGKPADIFVAAQYGADLGLRFMTAVQNIAIIGGKPALPSDIKLAMVRSRKLLERMTEASDDEVRQSGIAWCEMKRVGVEEPIRHVFSVEDAKQAGLWELRRNNYPTPWVLHKWRMLSLKPRDMCLRDLFGDVFKGLHSVEEARDIQLLESVQTPAAQIAQQSQPDTKGKEILDVQQEPLKSQTVDVTTLGRPSQQEMAERAAREAGQPEQPGAALFGTASKQFADAVDQMADKVREMAGGNAALLKLWSSYKMPVKEFAKGKPSSLLTDTELDKFSVELESLLGANGPTK